MAYPSSTEAKKLPASKVKGLSGPPKRGWKIFLRSRNTRGPESRGFGCSTRRLSPVSRLVNAPDRYRQRIGAPASLAVSHKARLSLVYYFTVGATNLHPRECASHVDRPDVLSV